MDRPEQSGSDFERLLRRELAEAGLDCGRTTHCYGVEVDIPIERGLWNRGCPKIAIEAKRQHSGGSAEDKLPTQLARWESNAENLLTYFDKLVWVIDGPEITSRVWWELEIIADKVHIIKYSDTWLEELLLL